MPATLIGLHGDKLFQALVALQVPEVATKNVHLEAALVAQRLAMQETIDLLHAHRIKMAIASSRTSASLLGFVREMNLTDKIAMVVGSDEVAHHKPHPEPVNVILSALDVSASETIVVGDMPVDILMGVAAGTHTCAVTYGNASAEELSAAGAEFLIEDMAELGTIVVPTPPSPVPYAM